MKLLPQITNIAIWVLNACAYQAPASSLQDKPHPRPPHEVLMETTAPMRPIHDDGILRGELPWWHELEEGIYRFNGRTVVLAVGQSADHHHSSEGFLKARVAARLKTRKAAESIRFEGTMPEPQLSDLFITRRERFLALYQLNLPKDVQLPSLIENVEIPHHIQTSGRHRIGRHIFEDGIHVYQDCEVEGPITNPDWGRNRATASHEVFPALNEQDSFADRRLLATTSHRNDRP